MQDLPIRPLPDIHRLNSKFISISISNGIDRHWHYMKRSPNQKSCSGPSSWGYPVKVVPSAEFVIFRI